MTMLNNDMFTASDSMMHDTIMHAYSNDEPVKKYSDTDNITIPKNILKQHKLLNDYIKYVNRWKTANKIDDFCSHWLFSPPCVIMIILGIMLPVIIAAFIQFYFIQTILFIIAYVFIGFNVLIGIESIMHNYRYFTTVTILTSDVFILMDRSRFFDEAVNSGYNVSSKKELMRLACSYYGYSMVPDIFIKLDTLTVSEFAYFYDNLLHVIINDSYKHHSYYKE